MLCELRWKTLNADSVEIAENLGAVEGIVLQGSADDNYARGKLVVHPPWEARANLTGDYVVLEVRNTKTGAKAKCALWGTGLFFLVSGLAPSRPAADKAPNPAPEGGANGTGK